MEQSHNVLPERREEGYTAVLDSEENKKNSALLNKVSQNFGFFGGISLIFGVGLAFCFYKAGIGLNVLLFAIVMVILLNVIMNKLSISIKRATIAYHLGTILLGLSSMLTSSGILQFLNIVGMLLLLDLSLLHQFNEDNKWDFSKHFGRMLSLVFTSMARIGMPFRDCLEFLKKTKLFKNDKLRNVVTGIAISLPLLWVIIALLSSADLLFGKMTHQIYTFLFSSNLFFVLIIILIGFITCYCIICGAVFRAGIAEDQKLIKKADSSIAVTAMILLCLVYVVFCGIQILYLFADGVLVLPAEFTFSEYARRGFFQLLAVTIINIALMLLFTTLFEESKSLRFLLTCMTVCTYIMIGSAVYRMLLYIGAYKLTFLRLFVLLFLLIDAFVLAGVIISVYNKKFPLFGYCVAVVSACYLLFSFAKPDYFIALYQIQGEVKYEDIIYLTEELSSDAASVLVPYLSELNSTAAEDIQTNYDQIEVRNWAQNGVEDYCSRIVYKEEKRGIRDFNFSDYFASRVAFSVKK